KAAAPPKRGCWGPISPPGSARSWRCRPAPGRLPRASAPGRWPAAPWHPPSASRASRWRHPTGSRGRAASLACADGRKRMHTALAYVGAAVAEIAGCFAFWAWLRLGASPWWLLPGVASLLTFAYLLTLADAAVAGRAYAAYGGIYISASLLWLW